MLGLFYVQQTGTKKRHQRVQRYTGSIFKMAIRSAAFRSYGVEGTISHNESRVSTPACYLLL